MLGLPIAVEFLMLAVAGALGRRQARVIAHLQLELRILRAMVPDARLRFSDAQRKQLARSGNRLGRKDLTTYATLVHPDTVLRWYRELIRRKYDHADRRRPGRPRLSADVAALILDMAKGNPSWGYTRRSTVRRTLAREGSIPPPRASPRLHGSDC